MNFKYSRKGLFSKLFLIFLTAVCLWILAANLWVSRGLIVDDAFIGFRYASNLAKGYGLIWNKGDAPSEGYSNLLSILIASFFLRNGLDPALISKIIGVLSLLACAFFIYKICIFGGVKPAAALLSSCVYISQPAIARHAFSGLETNLFSALLTFFFFYAVTVRLKNGFNNSVILLIAYSLVILSRTEGIFFATIFLIFLFFYNYKSGLTQNKTFFYCCAISFLIGVIYSLWRLFYFKTLITGPMLLKAGNLLCLPGRAELILFLSRHSCIFLFAFFGLVLSYGKRNLPAYLVFFSALIVATYLFNYHISGFVSRYFIPSLPFVLILAAYAFDFLLSTIPKKWIRGLFMFACIFFITPSNINPYGTNYVRVGRFFFREKIPETWTDVDIKIGRQLSRIKSDGQLVVAAEDIGAIAFYSEWKVIDLVGLVNSPILFAKNALEFSDSVFSYNPDLVIIRSSRWKRDPSASGPAVSSPARMGNPLARFGYSSIYGDVRFKNKYIFLGKILDSEKESALGYWNFWARRDSPAFNQLSDVFKSLVAQQERQASSD